MAAPTIASLTPSIGLASGDQLITITGTGFNVPVDEAPGTVNPRDPVNPSPLYLQTAIVTFDGVASPLVKVFSSTVLTAVLPPGNPGAVGTPPPGRAVTVQVINVTQGTLTPIMGESVTAVNAFTYTRPLHTSEYESDFDFAIRTLLQLFKANLFVTEVNWAVQTDYDPTTGDELHVTKFAQLPGIVLIGPDLSENRFYSENEQPEFDDGTILPDGSGKPAGFLVTRVPFTVDVKFDVVCASNVKGELWNIGANFVKFMHTNKYLFVDRDSADATKGQVKYEMDFAPDGLPKAQRLPNNSNVFSWSASILIRGFDIEAFSGLASDGTSDPAQLIPAHAVVDRGHYAANVVLAPTAKLGITSPEGDNEDGECDE